MTSANPRGVFSSVLDSARWDWYQVTVKERALDVLLPLLSEAYPLADWSNAKGQHGYLHGYELKVGSRRLLHVLYGGQNGTANITASGEDAPAFAEQLRRWGGDFKPTRVDSCLDWEEPALFDTMARALLQYATEKELRISQLGDWHRNKSRTLYVGSPKSPVQLRLYEKGYQVGGEDTAHPDWVRLEVQVRPAKQRRSAAAAWEPSDAFCAGWVCGALERLLLLPGVRLPVGNIKGPTDQQKQRAWLLRQAGKVLHEWAEEYETPEEFGKALVSALAEGRQAAE